MISCDKDRKFSEMMGKVAKKFVLLPLQNPLQKQISKIQQYEKNQTIPVSHDHLFHRIVQHTKA